MVRLRRRRHGGFTMIELLISMALASIGLLGLLALQVSATRGNSMSRNFVEAIGLAQNQLESAEYYTYANLSALASGTLPCNTSNAGSSTMPPGSSTTYYLCTTLSNPSASTTTIQVDVYWQEYLNAGVVPHKVTISTTRSP